jgi:hypothetical protein
MSADVWFLKAIDPFSTMRDESIPFDLGKLIHVAPLVELIAIRCRV